MAAAEDNFGYSDYVSDDGNTYSMRSLAWWAALPASGGTASSNHPLYGRQTTRRHPRKVKFADLAAPGRYLTLPVFTAAAWNAIVPGTTTVNRSVRGEAAARAYTAVKKIPEAQPAHVITSAATQAP